VPIAKADRYRTSSRGDPPVRDALRWVSLRFIPMLIRFPGLTTRGNVSVDVSAVAFYRPSGCIRSRDRVRG
jgi:hypothetical protein